MIDVLKQKITQWRTKGAVVPSSRFLVDKMISKIHYIKNLELLQLGYGEGVFTQAILNKLKQGSRITVFEVDVDCRKYQIDDKRIRYIEDSAENISQYFQEQRFDCILSTLPLASLSKNICQNIFREVKKHLKRNGTFLQFQYSLISKSDIAHLFNADLDIDLEVLNIPPAFIYEIKNCGKVKG